MNRVPEKARVTDRSGPWGVGTSADKPDTAKGAGGGNLKRGPNIQLGGSARNKGRLNGGREIHHDGQAIKAIGQGATSPSR